jgi:hypothetical protein
MLMVKNGLLRGLDTVGSDEDFAGRMARSVQEHMAPVRDVAHLAAQENRTRRVAKGTCRRVQETQ